MQRGLRYYVVFYLIVIYIPVFLIPVFSFNDSIYIKLPFSGFTTQWYRDLFSNAALLGALTNSLKVAAAASLVSTLLGLLAAIGLVRFRVRGWQALTAFMTLPIILPSLVMGISILMTISYLGIDLSLYSVLLGHILICTPFALLVIMPRLEGFDSSLLEASRDLGRGSFMTFVLVTLPLVAPALVSSVLLTATLSLDEFLIAFFLSGTEPTLPVYIWGQLRFPDQLPSVLALGTIIIIVSVVMVVAAEWLARTDDYRRKRN